MPFTRREILPGIAMAALPIQPCKARSLSLDEGSPLPEPDAAIETGVIWAERRGAGAPLIFIPGLAGGIWSWTEMVRRFAPTHTVYVLTLAGFDGRAAAAGPIIDRVVADAARLIAENQLERPLLVGHSLGGFIALRIGIEHPALIGGLVTVDGYPVFPPLADADQGVRRAAAERLSQPFAAQMDIGKFRAVLEAFFAARMNDPAQAAQAADHAARSDSGAVADYVMEMLPADLRPELGRLKAPLLALAAVNSYKSGLSEPEMRTFYAGLLANAPRASILLISDARHFAMKDQPEVVGAAIEGFLAGLRLSAL